MPEELKKLEHSYIYDLEQCKTSLEAANVVEKALIEFGMKTFARKYTTFIQERSSLHHK